MGIPKHVFPLILPTNKYSIVPNYFLLCPPSIPNLLLLCLPFKSSFMLKSPHAFLPTQHEFIHTQQAYQSTCFFAHPPCQTTRFYASTAMVRSWSATMPNHLLQCPPSVPKQMCLRPLASMHP